MRTDSLDNRQLHRHGYYRAFTNTIIVASHLHCKHTHLPKQHGQHHFVALRRKAFGKKNMGRLLLLLLWNARGCRSSGRIAGGKRRRRLRCCLHGRRTPSGSRGRRSVVGDLSPLRPWHVGPVSLGDPIRFFPRVSQLEILSEEGEPLFRLEGRRRRLHVFEENECLASEPVLSERDDLQHLSREDTRTVRGKSERFVVMENQ